MKVGASVWFSANIDSKVFCTSAAKFKAIPWLVPCKGEGFATKRGAYIGEGCLHTALPRPLLKQNLSGTTEHLIYILPCRCFQHAQHYLKHTRCRILCQCPNTENNRMIRMRTLGISYGCGKTPRTRQTRWQPPLPTKISSIIQ